MVTEKNSINDNNSDSNNYNVNHGDSSDANESDDVKIINI